MLKGVCNILSKQFISSKVNKAPLSIYLIHQHFWRMFCYIIFMLLSYFQHLGLGSWLNSMLICCQTFPAFGQAKSKNRLNEKDCEFQVKGLKDKKNPSIIILHIHMLIQWVGKGGTARTESLWYVQFLLIYLASADVHHGRPTGGKCQYPQSFILKSKCFLSQADDFGTTNGLLV